MYYFVYQQKKTPRLNMKFYLSKLPYLSFNFSFLGQYNANTNTSINIEYLIECTKTSK